MNGPITLVQPIGDKEFYAGWGVVRMEYDAGIVDSPIKLLALCGAIEAVVLGDVRCEQSQHVASVLLYRDRPSGCLPLTSRGINNALGVLLDPVKSIGEGEWCGNDVLVRFRFALREWHLWHLRRVKGASNVGYARLDVYGKSVVVITFDRDTRWEESVLRLVLARAVTAGLTF